MKGGKMKTKKMEKKDIALVVIIALVVAVIASLVTVSITGNAINVAKGTAGKVYTAEEIDGRLSQFESLFKVAVVNSDLNNYYTKAEVDAKLNSRTTNTAVLNMLKNNCILTNPDLYVMNNTYTLGQVCNKYNSKYGKSTTCVFADQWDGSMTRVLNCGLSLNKNNSGSVHVMCCSP